MGLWPVGADLERILLRIPGMPFLFIPRVVVEAEVLVVFTDAVADAVVVAVAVGDNVEMSETGIVISSLIVEEEDVIPSSSRSRPRGAIMLDDLSGGIFFLCVIFTLSRFAF